MKYLSDSVDVVINGQKRRIGLAVSNGHLIGFYRRGGFLDDVVTGVAGMTGIALGGGVLPLAAGALIANSLMGERFSDFEEDIKKIRNKFKLKDDEIFISDEENSRVTVKKWLWKTAVTVEGRFARGDVMESMNIEFPPFDSFLSTTRSIFESQGYAVKQA